MKQFTVLVVENNGRYTHKVNAYNEWHAFAIVRKTLTHLKAYTMAIE